MQAKNIKRLTILIAALMLPAGIGFVIRRYQQMSGTRSVADETCERADERRV